jgi:hypothetical protein
MGAGKIRKNYMPGNEVKTTRYLIENINQISLPHLGCITKIESPTSHGRIALYTVADLNRVVTEDSEKKADILINGVGVSLKQSGGSFPYNRLQRADLLSVFRYLNFNNPEAVFTKFDEQVKKFHDGQLNGRSRPWQEFMEEKDFYTLTNFLMTKGSPNRGISSYPATLILESPKENISANNIKVFTFDEYFRTNLHNITISIRRQWYGQVSNSEHNRARGIMGKPDNQPWVFSEITGNPRPRNGKIWRTEIPENERREVYFIMLEKH